MANSKISALTSATTPVAGTETLPIVQSSTTKQVSIANLTAGRAVAALSFTSNSRTVLGSGGWWDNAASGNNVGMVSGGAKITPSDGSGSVTNNTCDLGSSTGQWKTIYAGTTTTVANRTVVGAGYVVDNATSGNNAGIFFGPSYIGPANGAASATNNVTDLGASSYAWKDFYIAGNVIQKTAAKGINFTANTGAAGKTSQLLNWYEEGTFTPVVADAATGGNTGTAALAKGRYTRVGRNITVTIAFLDITTTGMTAGNTLYVRALPYTSVTDAFVNFIGSQANSQLASTNGAIYPVLSNNSSAIYFLDGIAAGSNNTIKVSGITSGQTDLYITLTYEAA